MQKDERIRIDTVLDSESEFLNRDLYEELSGTYRETQDRGKDSYAYKSIVARYNVRSISLRQIQQLANELYQIGLISARECLDMSEPVMSEDFNKTNFKAKVDAEKGYDFLEDWRKKLKWEKENKGTPEQIKRRQDVVAILEGLDMVRNEIYEIKRMWYNFLYAVKSSIFSLKDIIGGKVSIFSKKI